jgi:peptidoglycan hydrolase-like protein with peptidoglycan-binding domain
VDDVKSVQDYLIKDGHDISRATGTIGAQTRGALLNKIAGAQQEAGMPVTGQWSRELGEDMIKRADPEDKADVEKFVKAMNRLDEPRADGASILDRTYNPVRVMQEQKKDMCDVATPGFGIPQQESQARPSSPGMDPDVQAAIRRGVGRGDAAVAGVIDPSEITEGTQKLIDQLAPPVAADLAMGQLQEAMRQHTFGLG